MGTNGLPGRLANGLRTTQARHRERWRSVTSMATPHEQTRIGLDAIATMTALKQRVRLAHPTFGTYEAAELEWWWSIERSTDGFDQLFWFDEQNSPVAASVMVDFGDGTSAVYTSPVIVTACLPDATPEWKTHVIERGLEHVAAAGVETVEFEVDRADTVLADLLVGRGFEITDDGTVECWLDAADRPAVSELSEGYRLARRSETSDLRHHMTDPRRLTVEQRLQETSLYRPDLDLVVLDGHDNPAAYGMFWYDPITATGVVEPMRTHDDHQQRGLARHVLTAGIELLAEAGAERVSICYEPENPASGLLYRSVGFVPHDQTDLLSGPTRPPTS